jgi:hypothetical protein
MRCWFVAALVMAGTVLSAQKPTGLAAGTSTIAGVVREAGTDLPIADADVEIFEPRRAFGLKAKTNADGRFVFEGIADGAYLISASSKRHCRLCFGATEPDGRGCAPVTVVPDQIKDDIDFKLSPGAVVRGVLFDENQKPLANQQVTAGRPAERRVLMDAMARTNPKGEFEFLIPPGEFMISLVSNGIAGPLKRAAVYYPGVFNFDEATHLEAVAGATIAKADIHIPKIELYKFDVRPASDSSEPLSTFALSLVAEGTNPAAIRLGVVEEDFHTSIAGLDAGPYVMHAKGEAGNKALAAWEFLPINQDLVDYPIVLKPTGTITGRIVQERGGVAPVEGWRVAATFTLNGKDADPQWAAQGAVGADGRFTIEELYGTRVLRVVGLGEDWEVRSILQGRSEVRTSGVDVESGQTIDVVIIVGRR